MTKKGFTLIELLAVIGIISIVAVITTPVVLDVIKDSKENAFVDSANSLISSARNYQTKNGANALTVTFNNGTSTPALSVKGDINYTGTIKLDEKGKASLALWDDKLKKCVVKKTTEKKPTISKTITTSSKCVIS